MWRFWLVVAFLLLVLGYVVLMYFTHWERG